MKHFKIWAFMLLMTLSCGIFTSCDEDRDLSMVISGEWYGDFGMSYDAMVYGRPMTFYATESRVVFYPHHNYATYGTGTQVDFYANGPYESIYYRFRWTTRNGVIYLTYPYEDSYLNTEISDYWLSDSRFEGFFGWTDSRFCLHKISGYYDWSLYYNDYGHYDRNYRYSPSQETRSAEIDAIAPDTVNSDSIKIIRIGKKML